MSQCEILHSPDVGRTVSVRPKEAERTNMRKVIDLAIPTQCSGTSHFVAFNAGRDALASRIGAIEPAETRAAYLPPPNSGSASTAINGPTTCRSQYYLALLPYASERRFGRTQVLFECGDDGDSMFLVLKGQVEIFVDYRKRRTLISRKWPGDVFGELALLGDGKRTASAVARVDSCLGVVQRSDFDRCLEENPRLRQMLVRDQVDLIGQLTMRVSTTQLGAYSRLRFSLLEMARPGSEGLEIPGRLTQRDLAAHAGCTRETAAKIVATLKRGGWLRFERDRVVILKPLPEKF